MQTLPSDSGPGLVLAPFRGVRYARDRVSGIANVISPPYDVISGGILEHLRAADPHNVVRLILPGDGSGGSKAAADLLRTWLADGVLIRDPARSLYLYEQTARPAGADGPPAARYYGEERSGLAGGSRGVVPPGLIQRGVIGLVGLGSPGSAGILPHEDVMPSLVAGRRQLMAAAQANLEPIFLLHSGGTAGTEERVAARHAPLVSVTTEDGVTHRLWRLEDPGELAAITAGLAGGRALIADGHHRYAAYLGLQAEMRASGLGDGPWDYGLAFLVDSAVYPPRLGAIHRVLPGLPPQRAAELAKAAFTVQDLPGGLPLAAAQARLAAAGREGTAFLLADGSGFRLLSNPDPVQSAASMPTAASRAWRRLDAAVLQQLLLGRLWGIADDERTVLIYHDAADAVRAAAGGGGTAVISNPLPFDAVIQVAEQGERVPRKSTSFGPKPRTGLVLSVWDNGGVENALT
ncbi:MAG: DUF1015 domain-containing protein [Streptosporangiaceae bacterium]|nr:DUF1015 domain-containing protein [Streptosporangiaceae bacterium]